jgi:hypothetical protein
VPTTGWKTAGTVTTVSNGGVNWTNPGNIGASDDSYAVATNIPSGNNSYDLRATNFGFTSSDIPAGSTIDGVEVEVEARADNASRGNIPVGLRNVTGGSVKWVPGPTSSSYLTTSDVTTALGGASDRWGATISQANVVNSAFGVNMAGSCDAATVTISIDFVRMRVHYSLPLSAGRADETDTAQALVRKQIRAVGRANETDTAFTRSGLQLHGVGRSDEAGSVFALAGVQFQQLGLAIEADSAFALGSAVPVGMAIEVDGAIRIINLALGMASETDAAFALVGRISALAPAKRTIDWPANRLEDRTVDFTRGSAG